VEESEVSVAASVMDGFDTNKNGKISLQELLDRVGDDKEVNAAFAGWKQGFLEADADKDGQLSVEELSALLQRVSRKDQNSMIEQSEVGVADRIMNGFDTDNDGKISVMELMDRIEENKELDASFKGWREGFKEADVDQDMHLTKDELANLLQRVSRKRQHTLVEQSEETMAASILQGLDLDEDGKLSLQELMARVGNNKELEAAFAGWKQGFSDSDVDKDGHLTVKELASLLKRVSTKDQGQLIQNVPATTASLLQGLDVNRDGKLSMSELLRHKMASASGSNWKEGFKQADANRDGSLDGDELITLFEYINDAHTRRDEM
jgi:Ca2+-binding EF-hand superfamily protein